MNLKMCLGSLIATTKTKRINQYRYKIELKIICRAVTVSGKSSAQSLGLGNRVRLDSQGTSFSQSERGRTMSYKQRWAFDLDVEDDDSCRSISDLFRMADESKASKNYDECISLLRRSTTSPTGNDEYKTLGTCMIVSSKAATFIIPFSFIVRRIAVEEAFLPVVLLDQLYAVFVLNDHALEPLRCRCNQGKVFPHCMGLTAVAVNAGCIAVSNQRIIIGRPPDIR